MSSARQSGLKFVGGVIIGVLLVTIWYAIRPEHWSESAAALSRECAEQGLHTEFTVADGHVSSWECVAP